MSRELRTAKMKKSSGGIKKSFTNKKFKSGAYSSFITILVIASIEIGKEQCYFVLSCNGRQGDRVY